MKITSLKFIAILFMGLVFKNSATAQFEFNGQLVQRVEYRHGYGKLIPDTVDPSAFISQRLRFQFTYNTKYVKLFASIQDVRTWGSTSQLNATDNLLSMHEGWAEIPIDTMWSVKIGRQELVYDNSRFLGNVDWSMQARSHDFALLKFSKNDHKLHIGGGYNQDAETIYGGDYYKTANQYKTAQMLWYNYKHNDLELSILFWNNGKQDTTTGHRAVRYSQTIGLPTIKYSFMKNNLVSAFAYYQTVKDVNNRDLSCYDISIQGAQTFDINAEKISTFKVTLGVEMLSGTNTNNTANTNNSYNPMYGTNHMYNGYMDYFYVSGRFENSVGLNDLYLKFRYDMNKKWFAQTDLHYFLTNANVYNANDVLSQQLGAELDLTGGYVFNENISLQAGYSQLFASSTIKYLESSSASKTQNWAYLMLIVRPKSDKKFIGIYN
ncbi:MAG: hypothetical protein IPN72_22385 [Saprospiraceae bacterium]|nr:hypothetical protein [Saprospiraceae bacterium]